MRLFEAVCSSALDRPNENTCGYVRGVDGVNTAAVTLGGRDRRTRRARRQLAAATIEEELGAERF
jgi:hypothetical protein